jgi:hypothetical protein
MDFPELDKLVEDCDPDTKLAVAAWVFKHIVNHAREGGSYRCLIYSRLGFGTEAYVPLCDDGITISNEFDLGMKDRIIEAYKSKDEKKLKEALGLCDETECFKYVSCGWPSDSGYRSTCSDHYEGKLKNV